MFYFTFYFTSDQKSIFLKLEKVNYSFSISGSTIHILDGKLNVLEIEMLKHDMTSRHVFHHYYLSNISHISQEMDS